jgi:riboflavin synthase
VFTGLVEGLGRIERVVDSLEGRRLTIGWRERETGDPLKLGESISVNGCCLTVVAVDGFLFDVQAGPETLARTNLGDRTSGERVNLERSLKVGERLGGHFVQGHIDTTADLRKRERQGEWEFLEFGIDPRWTDLMISKGSIAVDGISLTLVDVSAAEFSVMLIPHTLAVTTLGTSVAGDRVNIEIDMLAKHLKKLYGSGQP